MAKWRCTLTDWSTPPEGMAWEADMGDGWTLTVDVMAEGLAWGVRATDWESLAEFIGGMSPDLETAMHLAEKSHAAGPLPAEPVTATWH